MADRVASHYSENLELADAIAQKLRSLGKDLNKLTTADLVSGVAWVVQHERWPRRTAAELPASI